MKNIKKIISALFVLLISGYTMGQSNKTALSVYKKHGYRASIPLLEKSAANSIENKEKIANSYRLNHDTENAEIWYQQIIDNTSDPIHYLHYAQVLQSNEKFALADQYYSMYEQETGDARFTDRKTITGVDKQNTNNHSVRVKNIPEINSEKIEYSPYYFEDQLIFLSNRFDKHLSTGIADLWTDDNFMSIWTAKISEDGSLGTPAPLSMKLNSKYNEGPACISRDGDKIFFTRNNYHNGKRKNNSEGVMKLSIYSSVKKGNDWSEPKSINLNTEEYDEAHPSISYNGDRLIFSSDRKGGFGGMDLYYSDFVNGSWREPINLGPEINTPGNDVFPYIHKDGTLYYASNGRLGYGGLDLYQAKKDENKDWTQVTNMGAPFNSPKDDFAMVMNESKTEGFLSSARLGGLGKDDIYSFQSEQPIDAFQTKGKKDTPTTIVKAKISVPQNESKTIQTELASEDTKLSSTHKVKSPELSMDNTSDSNSDRVQSSITSELKSDITKTSNSDLNTAKELNLDASSDSDITEDKSNTNNNNALVKANTLEDNSLTRNKINSSRGKEEDKSNKADIIELPYVYYDFNSSYLRNDVKDNFSNVISFMKENPNIKIELRSHSDSRGSASYNLMLSQKRAESLVKYLIAQGIDSERLVAKGYGETQLKNKCGDYSNCSEEEHQSNRRTEIRIIGNNENTMVIKQLNNPPQKVDKANPNRKWDWN